MLGQTPHAALDVGIRVRLGVVCVLLGCNMLQRQQKDKTAAEAAGPTTQQRQEVNEQVRGLSEGTRMPRSRRFPGAYTLIIVMFATGSMIFDIVALLICCL